MRPRAAFALAAVLTCACGSESTPITCVDRPEDSTGYLKPICEYIVAKYDSYSVDPNTLRIVSMMSGDMAPGALAPYDTADYDWVELSCCFMGDTAVMERSTHAVVNFDLGDI